ncbi:endonuclease/exonuclease/phosphatase family protein [Oceanomicrobium pacificus]|uniref:Endonuclease/exonuclease/phosphatase family protein n=1 Tax=Oceanomicrobium pacificus TaxID=2692916 RepID=A0A6B0TPM7_9RHOB|nr:endonuclease/exonuclease/phosphatase family protein [Oceanomicrobium pacificus]MXU64599.1 endonuclease/exonuclease/phosphatase family protein [Oceanomicrobium pacificus]
MVLRVGHLLRGLLLAPFLLSIDPVNAGADTLRVATFDAGLSRAGPGRLIRDLQRDENPALAALFETIETAGADILLLTGTDHDFEGRAAALIARRAGFPVHLSVPPNAGVPSGHDLDGDGSVTGAADGWGYGRFPGHGGMLLLSRHPFVAGSLRSYQTFRWADLPDVPMPVQADGTPFFTAEADEALPVSSNGLWTVQIDLPAGPVTLVGISASTPVFDGPEDANGRRNAAELTLLRQILDGAPVPDDAGSTAPLDGGPVILAGKLNLDPLDGAGQRAAVQALLSHARLQDAGPEGPPPAVPDKDHAGDPRRDTARWAAPPDGPGALRVDYVLPDRRLSVAGGGIVWPSRPDDAGPRFTRHGLLWLDLVLP